MNKQQQTLEQRAHESFERRKAEFFREMENRIPNFPGPHPICEFVPMGVVYATTDTCPTCEGRGVMQVGRHATLYPTCGHCKGSGRVWKDFSPMGTKLTLGDKRRDPRYHGVYLDTFFEHPKRVQIESITYSEAAQ